MQSGTIKQKLLAAMLSLSIIVTLVGGGIAGRTTVSAESDTADTSKPPIARYTFDNSDKWLANSAGDNDFGASLVNASSPGDVISTDRADPEHGGYLDLTGQGNGGAGAYLSISGEILRGLSEITIEMDVKTSARDNSSGNNNWLFFAAPNNEVQEQFNGEHYIGAVLNPGMLVQRFANVDARPAYSQFKTADWPYTADTWHTVRFVVAKDYTRVYIDGQVCAEKRIPLDEDGKPLGLQLKDCVSADGNYSNTVLYFGHSTRDEGFNGYIDNVTIWDYANELPDPYEDVDEETEAGYILGYDDPKNTVVNMFDYWITGQTDNDYRPDYMTIEYVMSHGINEGHPFLFSGYDSVEYGYDGIIPLEPNKPGGGSYDNIGLESVVGTWNASAGKDYFVNAGIVQSVLDGGYPMLSGTMNNQGKLSAEALNKLGESLSYLFDPSTGENQSVNQPGKASYPDVTGLFRLQGGYYIFDSAATFAELNIQDTDGAKLDHSGNSGNHITLYGKNNGGTVEGVWRPVGPYSVVPASGDEGRSRGQFFPFNDWSDLFHVDENGRLVQNHDYIYYQNMAGNELINHYFGMTIETEFVQPVNGKVNHGEDDMIFEFSGDDDVWIFIDDVLVGDVGGLHSKINVRVNFADGSIKVDTLEPNKSAETVFTETTLKDQFISADRYVPADFKEDTFAGGTTHTLKFFYLERGNNISNCRINFNLQSVQPDVVQKADEDGNGLEGAEFKLFPAQLKGGNAAGGQLTSDSFEIMEINGVKEPLITIVTSGEDGSAEFRYKDNEYKNDDFIIVFADLEYEYYILRETDTPTGYRTAKDIILQYHPNTNTLTVVNKYETGAYASFSAYFEQLDLENVYTAEYTGGTPQKNEHETVAPEDLKDGLAFIVPTMKVGSEWLPLYGSNAKGWTTVKLTASDYKQALLEAVIRQIAEEGAPEMYMTWNAFKKSGEGSLSAALEDIPGNAERYIGNNSEGDLSYATLFLPKDVLTALGVSATASYADSTELFEALKTAVKAAGADSALNAAKARTGLELLYTGNFDRTYRTIIHIVDMQQKLVIRKVDTDGKPLAGAVFALYDNAGKAAAGGDDWIVSDATGDDGILVLTFEELADGLADGQYWLREITAPEGYQTNPNLIQVIVDGTYVFANASAYTFIDGEQPRVEKVKGEDNVKVYAAAGTLAQSVIRFTDNDVLNDLQLGQITGEVHTAAQANSGYTLSWNGTGKPFALYFNGNGQNENFKYTLLDYAREADFDPADYEDADALLEALGAAVTEDGFICVKPTKDGIDISPMFSLLNIIEVTDEEEKEEEEEEEEEETVEVGIVKDQSVNDGDRTTDRLIVTENDIVTYYLTVTVSGTEGAELKGIIVQDMVPEGLELIEGSIASTKSGTVINVANKDNRTQIIEWVLGTGTAEEVYTLSYSVKVPHVDKNTTWVNTAYITSGFEDNEHPTYPDDPDDPPGDWEPSNSVEIEYPVVEPVTADFVLRVSKTLLGRDWIEDFDSYAFELTGHDSVTEEAIANGDIIIEDGRVVIDKEGQNASFGNITFNIEGEFTFAVTETDRKNGSIDYDETVYVITVKVVDNEEGQLVIDGVSVIRLKDADADIESGTAVAAEESTYDLGFENAYSAICSWPPVIIKQVIGRAWREADEFEFVLELLSGDKSGVIMPEDITIKGTADSFDDVTAPFGEVTFTKPGLYTFRLSETLPESGHNSGGLIFDTGYYLLTVSVAAEDGVLEFSLVGVTRYENADDTEGTAYTDDAYRFTNIYSLIFDDDGVPRGDLNLPEDDDPQDNVPTGVTLGGYAYAAAGAVILSGAALVVRRRRRGRNEK